MAYAAITYETGPDHVATVTLNRPDKLNAFNRQMLDDFRAVWAEIRDADDVHTVVLRANGRAFSAGLDVSDPTARAAHKSGVPFNDTDPAFYLGAKANRVWKPVVCAVHGMAAGGAFYWINESDIVICSSDAQFFDPHVTYGMTSALEPIGMRYKMPLHEVLRMVLMGNDERMGADTALRISLVTEVVAPDELWARADAIARQIADKPTIATQGSVRAIWESLDVSRAAALERGMGYPL